MKKSLFALCACALLFAACKQEVPPVPAEIVVEQNEYQIPVAGTEDLVIPFTSTKSWTASLKTVVGWLVITPSSGDAGDCEIHVIAEASKDYESREAVVVIKSDDLTSEITLVQGQVDNCTLVATSQDFDEKGGEAVVTVKTNIEWTVTVPEDAASWVHAVDTKAYGEQSRKFTVDPFDEIGTRTAVLKVVAGESSADFTIRQTYVPYLSVSQDLDELGIEGGSVVITVDANTAYTYEVSEGVSVVEATTDKENIRTYTCTVEKNSSWQPLSFGAWFTVPAIQDPVKDENGNETGETEDHVEGVYFSQASYAVFEYGVAIPESAFGAKKYSVAVVEDKLAVANGSTVVLFNKADGAFVQDLQVEGVWAITNDDAGNVLVITGDGAYPTEENPNPAGLTFLVAPASSFTDTKTWVTINTYKNGFYGLGIDNPTVRGNLLEGDAVITMASSGSTTYGVFFQFKDGKLMTASGEESELGKYTAYVACPETSGAVWNAKLMAYICVSNKFNEGVLFSGYDGNYSLFYNPSTSNWTATGLVYGSWASAISYADIVEFGGKTLYIGLQMTLFPQWAMASAIDVVDITDISAPKHLAEISYSNPDNTEGENNTAVLQCEKDGDNLAIYIVDGNQQSIGKLVLQPIK